MRAWAVAQLNATVQRSYAADGIIEGFPGPTLRPADIPLADPTALPEETK